MGDSSMNRQDALTALLAAQSKSKIEIKADTITSRPSSAGICGSVGSAFSRTRDRMQAAEASKPVPVMPTPKDANAAAWAAWEEDWRKKNGGHYVNR